MHFVGFYYKNTYYDARSSEYEERAVFSYIQSLPNSLSKINFIRSLITRTALTMISLF